MAIRKIIKIHEDRCNGCGLCVPNCAEGAIQIIDGKAKLVKDSYCDGLGACLGHCPQDALEIIEREAEDFNEAEAMEFVKRMKSGCGSSHEKHSGGCPGSRIRNLGTEDKRSGESILTGNNDVEIRIKSQLKHWPVQLSLVPVNAPFFDNADLLVTADCVPFAYANYHLELLKGKAVVVGCPKLDDIGYYTEKLAGIIKGNNIKSVTVAFMEVPCCSGIVRAVDAALRESGKDLPVEKVRISIDGTAERLSR
jgi:Pyruvate/2-oxoacid:ferredoxin oxidoreductase delta subunit